MKEPSEGPDSLVPLLDTIETTEEFTGLYGRPRPSSPGKTDFFPGLGGRGVFES